MKIQYLIFVFLSLIIYIWGASCQGRNVNINLKSTDQYAYLLYAKNISKTKFKHLGGRNRMPVYPAVISFFHRKGMSDNDFFEKIKKINTCISVIVLIFFYCILKKFSCHFDAFTAVLITGFTVFAFKAPYVQAEILFYGLFFILFVLISSLLSSLRIKTAFLIGLTAGIAHLTKASVIPVLLLCLLSLCIVIAKNIYNKIYLRTSSSSTLWKCIKTPLICGLVIVSVYLVLVFPYINNSKTHFGKYFYNVNTSFYMWYDSWEEAEKGTRAFGDRRGWPDMPADKIPGLRKYLQTHNAGQIYARFLSGLRTISHTAYRSYGYIFFIFIYIVFLAAVILHNRKDSIHREALCKNTAQIFFYTLIFTGYLLMYAWYTPITSGSRFILSLFMPFLFLLVRLLNYAGHHKLKFKFGPGEIGSAALNPVLLLCLTAYMLTAFPFLISSFYGGS